MSDERLDYTEQAVKEWAMGVNDFLASLPNDDARIKFVRQLEVCLECGSLSLPCFCRLDD